MQEHHTEIQTGEQQHGLTLIHISEPTRQEENTYAVYCSKKKIKSKKTIKQNDNQQFWIQNTKKTETTQIKHKKHTRKSNIFCF